MSVDFQMFKRQLREISGLDLNHYKEQQMQRRINQWLARVGAKDYAEYIKRIREDAAERQRFLEYLTINTSQFYRDAQVFDRIRSEVLPELLQASRRLRIWSAGASVGAEIYTIAILLAEASAVGRHSLLATDIDKQALAKAAEGVYTSSYMTTMPKDLIQKYFTIDDKNNYMLSDKIKRMVTFREHNLLTDGFGNGYDLILCRNVFIYFTQETQQQLTARFAEALRPQGYFVVGSAETLVHPEEYGLLRKSYCIYQKQ